MQKTWLPLACVTPSPHDARNFVYIFLSGKKRSERGGKTSENYSC